MKKIRVCPVCGIEHESRQNDCRSCRRKKAKKRERVCIACGKLHISEEKKCKSCANKLYNEKHRYPKKKESIRLIEERIGRIECIKCGIDIHGILEFHHVDPDTKEYNVSHMLDRFDIEKIMAEVEKCVVLCKNCHGLVHLGLLEL